MLRYRGRELDYYDEYQNRGNRRRSESGRPFLKLFTEKITYFSKLCSYLLCHYKLNTISNETRHNKKVYCHSTAFPIHSTLRRALGWVDIRLFSEFLNACNLPRLSILGIQCFFLWSPLNLVFTKISERSKKFKIKFLICKIAPNLTWGTVLVCKN